MIGSVRRAVHVLAALALGAGAFVALGAAPASAADPLGYVIAQGEGECWLASVDLVTGQTTTIGDASPEKCAFDLEFTPDGTRLLGTRIVDDGDDEVAHLVEFDLTTGAVTDARRLGDFTVGGPGPRPGQPHAHRRAGACTPTSSPMGDLPPGAARGRSRVRRQRVLPLPREHRRHRPTLTYVNSVPQQFTVYHGLATSCAGVTSSVRNPVSDDDVELPRAAGGTTAARGRRGHAVPHHGQPHVDRSRHHRRGADRGDTEFASLDYDTAGTLYAVGFVRRGGGTVALDARSGHRCADPGRRPQRRRDAAQRQRARVRHRAPVLADARRRSRRPRSRSPWSRRASPADGSGPDSVAAAGHGLVEHLPAELDER